MARCHRRPELNLDRRLRLGESAAVLARRDNVLRQVAALEVNINRSRNRNIVKAKEMGPKKGKDGGGGKGDKGRFVIVRRLLAASQFRSSRL